MKVEKMKEEKVAEQVLEYPIKTELCQPGQDSIQPVKRRRLRRHDLQVGRNVADASGKIHMKKDVLDWHSFWLKVKHEVKEQVRSMDDESLKRGGFTKEEDAGACKVETGTAVKAEHAESSHQAGHESWQPKLHECLLCLLPV